MTTQQRSTSDTVPSRADWTLLLIVIAIAAVAYAPAWFGTPLWDDDHHLTPAHLRGLDGLVRIWTDVGATLQYYPLLHSTFWLLQSIWGDAVLGYHLFTLAAHAMGTVLVFLVLRRLAIPGALIAAALFALHPIQVESVAWMTELKNTLSTVLYLLAALAFFRFDESRRTRDYLLTTVWFVLALLTKTVTGMLPFTLAVVLWWKRGTLRARTDLLPLIPLAIVGVSMGLLTAWWEIEFNQTGTAAFAMTWTERVLVGGRAAWFQLGSLLWPVNLLFSYPRWEIDAGEWTQFLYPAAWGVALTLAWLMRARTRAPLAALLFFLFSLAPTLGLFNLYTFRYSYVADHYQYVACLGIFALAAASVAPWLTASATQTRRLGQAMVVLVLATCAVMTWRQSHDYQSAEVSYASVLRGHPDSWFAHANLGAVLMASAPDRAAHHLQQAIRLKPDLGEAHGNLGSLHLEAGRPQDAVDASIRALVIDPRLPGATRTLADAYTRLGRPDRAIEYYNRLLRLRPDDPALLASVGQALTAVGRASEAEPHLRSAVSLQPDVPAMRTTLGDALAQLGRHEEALAEYRRALDLDPRFAPAFYGRANVLQATGRLEDAVVDYRAALAIEPAGAGFHNNLAVALDRLGRRQEAETVLRNALAGDPGNADAAFNLARLLEGSGRLIEASGLYLNIITRDGNDLTARLRLAGVLVRLGRRKEAAQQVREVIALNPDQIITDPLLQDLLK